MQPGENATSTFTTRTVTNFHLRDHSRLGDAASFSKSRCWESTVIPASTTPLACAPAGHPEFLEVWAVRTERPTASSPDATSGWHACLSGCHARNKFSAQRILHGAGV